MVAEPGSPRPTHNQVKYATANPLMRAVIARFLSAVCAEVEATRPLRLADLGCGEGFFAESVAQLPSPPRYIGLELGADAIAAAHARDRRRTLVRADLLASPLRAGWADMAVCLEVLEHLEQPQRAVTAIAEHTSDRAIVSVPWEPYFRLGNLLRGKYRDSWGDHPEHVQHFTPATFERVLSGGFESVSVRTCFPWLIGLCRRTDRRWEQR